MRISLCNIFIFQFVLPTDIAEIMFAIIFHPLQKIYFNSCINPLIILHVLFKPWWNSCFLNEVFLFLLNYHYIEHEHSVYWQNLIKLRLIRWYSLNYNMKNLVIYERNLISYYFFRRCFNLSLAWSFKDHS